MTCKRIAKLLSEKQDHELSFSRRLVVCIHLSFCVFCRRLARQLALMHGLCKAIAEPADESPLQHLEGALSHDAKARMERILSQKNS